MASSTEPENHSSPDSRTKTKAGAARKLRVPKACYPCYKRKVKCDRNSPCSLCVKRGYAHLCTFKHPPTASKERSASRGTRQHHETSNNSSNSQSCCSKKEDFSEPEVTGNFVVTDSGNVLIDPQEWQSIQDKLAILSQSMHSLRSRLEIASTPPPAPPSSTSPSSNLSSLDGRNNYQTSPITTPTSPLTPIDEEKAGEGVRTRNALGGSPVHCGSDSITAFLLEKPLQRAIFGEDSVLSQLALDNQSATYPFLDLWSSNITSYSNDSVCAALPDDAVCRRLLRSYHDVRFTLYPVVTDFDGFQKNVHTLLENRAMQGMCTNNPMASLAAPFGFSISFIGILFAILASGSQVSDFSRKERSSMCQLYVSCAYQCLRNGNFLSQPSMEAIQTLLIIGDVLSYNMNPGIAYVTFGVAQRMSLTLGLHAESFLFRDQTANRRHELWWSMAWQDSHFGLSYDRPIEILSSCPQIPRAADSRPGNRAYFETMCSVISLILQLLREEILEGNKISDHTIPAYKIELDKILADAAPHLRSEDYCFTLRDHIQRLTLKLRSSYLVSEICRRSLKQSSSEGGKKALAPHLCQECIDSLLSTIEAFIEIHQIIPQCSRSWIHLHSAISAAFLLSVDEGAQTEPSVWAILEKLESVLSDLTSAAGHNAPYNSDNKVTRSPDSMAHDWSPPPQFSNSQSTINHNTPAPPAMGDLFSMDNWGSFGQTFMLSDFPLSTDSMMMGGGGSNNSKGFGMSNEFSQSMPMAAEEDGGVEFLMGTLNSLRKINAGFKAQKAEAKRNAVLGVEKKAAGGGCCMSRSREGTTARCH
ncbi:hypothetical protein TMatcc_008494 [Talaromyces marneffei ATCC 18224]|uniref:Zn(2)-C6 fungal-type domain-containing protein n=1 Tax=Talaromyces marneffei (strain ATCC 18224 / CBS 334.59 / QM 7333) TaxID=441960 RepID=B6QLV3_TALMQ|nr:uncharacterized protein EYB26_007828 [Talaromyces marneffei]EEA22080.1 conserved hypothetical protein [Talaromyces marneffei ATCC 18224]QGA20127.1 hypothetical protein EYB26_007828 [Talaromyces marneffei]